MTTRTTSLEHFMQAPLDERCFFADGGLGIYMYDHHYGVTETYRVRESDGTTRARLPLVPALAEAAEQYRLAVADARHLNSAADDAWTAAWAQWCDGIAAALDGRDEDQSMADVVAYVDWMELQEGSSAWKKWNRTGELVEGRGLRAWRARRRWQRIYDNEPRPDPVAEAAVYGARQQAVAAAECECERRMAAVEGEWKRAQQEVGEVRASAAAIIAHAEGELERAYEAALKVVPVGVYV